MAEDIFADIELEHDAFSLSDSDIDEIIGKEHTDEDGLSVSFLDDAIDAVDDFVDGNEQIPEDKKGFFKDIFKKGIKKKKPDDSYTDDAFSLDLYNNQITPQDYNVVMSGVFPDAVLSVSEESKISGLVTTHEYQGLDYAYQSLQAEASVLSEAIQNAPEGYKETLQETLQGVQERIDYVETQMNACADTLQAEYQVSNAELYTIHENNAASIEQVVQAVPETPVAPVPEPVKVEPQPVEVPSAETSVSGEPVIEEPVVEAPAVTTYDIDHALKQIMALQDAVVEETPIVSQTLESNNFIHTGILSIENLMHSTDHLSVAESGIDASLTMHDGVYYMGDEPVENYGFPTQGSTFHAIPQSNVCFSSLLSPEVNNTAMYEINESHNNFDPEADVSEIQGAVFGDMDDNRYREYNYNPEVVNGATIPMPGSSGTGFNRELEEFRKSAIQDETLKTEKIVELDNAQSEYDQLKDKISPSADETARIEHLASTIETIKTEIDDINTRQNERGAVCDDRISQLQNELHNLEQQEKQLWNRNEADTPANGADRVAHAGVDWNGHATASTQSEEAQAIYQKMEAINEELTLAKECKRINDDVQKDDGFVHQQLIGQVNNYANERNNAPQTQTENKETGKVSDEPVKEARKVDIKSFKSFYAREPVERFFEQVTHVESRAVSVARGDGTAERGYQQIKSSYLMESAQLFTAGFGFASLRKISADLDKRVGEAFDTFKANDLLDKHAQMTSKQLGEVLAKKDADGRLSWLDKRDAKKYSTVLAERQQMSAYFLKNTKGLSKEEIGYLKSREYVTNGNAKMFESILKKDLAQNGSVMANKIHLEKLGISDLKRLAKNPKKYGLTKQQSDLVKSLAARKEKAMLGNTARGKFSGIARSGASRFIRSLTTMDEGMAKLFSGAVAGARWIKTSGQLLRVSTDMLIRYKPDLKISKKLAKMHRKKQQRRNAVNKIRENIKKHTQSRVKSAADTTKQLAKKTGKNIQKKWNHSAVGKGFNKVSAGIKNSAGGKFVAKTGRKIAKATRKARKAVSVTRSLIDRLMSLPLKLVGKIFSVFNAVKAKILAACGSAIMYFIKILLEIYAIGALIVIFFNIFSLDFIFFIQKFEQSNRAVIEETINIYDDYDDLEADAIWVKEKDDEIYEEAVRFGESAPPAPYNKVYADHLIDEWGSPDKDKGYNIHYFDVHGHELESTTTNAKDIVALCAAMCDNHVIQRAGKWYDIFSPGKYALKRQFRDLLGDMHDLMVYRDPETGEPFSWEATDIYYCEYGCDLFDCPYYCDDYSYYENKYDEERRMVKYYQDLDHYTGIGCETYEYWDSDWQYEIVGGHYESDWDYDSWGDIYWYDYWVDDYEWVDHGDWVTEHYCPGHYNDVWRCYGHRDVDINITLYDLRYAIENNIYPEDWESKSYADLIRNFMEQGAWNSEWHANCAKNYRDGDWMWMYGFDIEEGAGFTTQETFSPGEIRRIIDDIPEDQLTESRKELLEFALDAVGRIGYQWGGKASGPGWAAQFGSSEEDDKGRKNGLDCSGFTQWVYQSSLGVRIPGSTAGFSGYRSISKDDLKVGDLGFYHSPGAEDNHVGIYAGKNKYGQDMWVHCSGSAGGVTYGTGNFKEFYNVLR